MAVSAVYPRGAACGDMPASYINRAELGRVSCASVKSSTQVVSSVILKTLRRDVAGVPRPRLSGVV